MIILAFFIASQYEMSILSWIVIIGLFLGFFCQRSRFCITASFRDPFMTGETTASVGVIAGLLVGIFGFTVIKFLSIGAVGPEDTRVIQMIAVYPHFWVKALIGGFILAGYTV